MRTTNVLLCWILCLMIFPVALFGGEAPLPADEGAQQPGKFDLTVQDTRISLTAQETSLKEVLEAIGQRLHIDVVARIPQDTAITVTFDQLSLPEVLKRLQSYANIAYRTEQGKITKVWVFPQDKGTQAASAPAKGPESDETDRSESESGPDKGKGIVF